MTQWGERETGGRKSKKGARKNKGQEKREERKEMKTKGEGIDKKKRQTGYLEHTRKHTRKKKTAEQLYPSAIVTIFSLLHFGQLVW